CRARATYVSPVTRTWCSIARLVTARTVIGYPQRHVIELMRAILVLTILTTLVADADARQLRGSISSEARYVELRPMRRDTVDSAQVVIDDSGRRSFEGRPVFCVAQTCTFYRPDNVEHAIALAHDFSLAAWTRHVEGLSAHLYLRSRQNLAGDFTWPRSDDAFDAVLAFAEFARERYRVRLGRQRSLTGLGFYSFDGVTGWYQGPAWLTVEAYAGRSLARALEEPRHEALRPIESFIPNREAWLFGAATEVQSGPAFGASLRYQREIWSDRAALVSERASIDVRSTMLRFFTVEAAADYDVAYNQIGKAHLTLHRNLLDNRLSVDLTGRRYLPFFELWTIWGVFSPVPYHELELQSAWRASQRVAVEARVGLRRYSDADAAVFIAPAADVSRRLALRTAMRVNDAVNVGVEYQLETGFGAFLSSGEASATWTHDDRWRASLYATAFQQILEFRTGEAAVFGIGASSAFHLRSDLEVSADAALYRQGFDNRPSAVDWTQRRASLALVWRFGRDPGIVQ
ncbi:MAG TPA: hypothetical protein VGD49_09870, partial [Longimicrobiales bacterium]